VRLTTLPVIVQPNAGMPREVDNRRIYFCSPEYLTSYARRYVSLGAGGVGGCCGTTPDHIREVARAIKPLERARLKPVALPAAERFSPNRLPRSREVRSRPTQRDWVTLGCCRRGYDLETIARAVPPRQSRRDQHS
jgi:homocysteine S-methyltransferase